MAWFQTSIVGNAAGSNNGGRRSDSPTAVTDTLVSHMPMIASMKFRRRRRLFVITGCVALLFGCVVIALCDRAISWTTESRVYANVADIPARDVALVLGTGPTMPDG